MVPANGVTEVNGLEPKTVVCACTGWVRQSTSPNDAGTTEMGFGIRPRLFDARFTGLSTKRFVAGCRQSCDRGGSAAALGSPGGRVCLQDHKRRSFPLLTTTSAVERILCSP